MVLINFDATQYTPSTGAGSDVFEDGEYSFHITGSEQKATANKNGTRLILTFSCLDEGFTGKRLVEGFNIVNPSETAVKIALEQLSAISYIVGVPRWTDTQQLHGIPLRIKLRKEPRDDKPELMTNAVLGYFDMNGKPASAEGGSTAPAAPTAAPVAVAPTTAPSPPPWPTS